MAAMADSTTMSPDSNLLSSFIPMLGQPEGSFDSSNSHLAGLQGHGTLHLGEDASSTARSSRKSFKISRSSSVSNYSMSPNDLEDSTKTNVAPQASGNDAAAGGSKVSISNKEIRETASKPRTRSSTASTSKQHQTQQQLQIQTENQGPKQKQQQTTSKLKYSPAKSKTSSGNSKNKSQPRNRSLERNRRAASKCRQKKKDWLTDLEANKYTLEKQYKSLHGEYSDLSDEVTQLKNLLMMHASCNDPKIDGWINNEAKTYIRRLSQNVGHQDAATAAANAAAAPDQAKQIILKDMESLASPESQVSNSVTPSENNRFSNDYMFNGMFDTDLIMGQPVSVS